MNHNPITCVCIYISANIYTYTYIRARLIMIMSLCVCVRAYKHLSKYIFFVLAVMAIKNSTSVRHFDHLLRRPSMS